MSPTRGGPKRSTVKPDDLVGHNEIAERYEVSLATVHKWKQRYPDFPEPLVELAMGPVFSGSEVQAWYSQRWG